MSNSSGKLILEMKNISKRFPGVLALDNVDFSLYEGEVHVLMGSNGAGKSTLMKVLSGSYPKDEGKIILDGKTIEINTTSDAQANGIAIIYQHFSQVGHLSIAENIFLGREITKHGLIDYPSLYNQAKKVINHVGMDIDVKTKVNDLSVSKRQMVEIAKALSFNSKILIMDEPTSALTKKETEYLFTLIRNLTKAGMGIVYISHRIDELSAIGDRVTVMKDGKTVGTKNIKDIEMSELVKMMVGKSVNYTSRENKDNKNIDNNEKVIELKNVCVTKNKLKNISFYIRKGEIVGLYGLMGSGRTELARTVFGIDDIDSGEILLNGKRVKFKSPEDAVKHGIGFLTEDRLRTGLNLNLEVGQNISLPNLKEFLKHGILNVKKEAKAIQEMIESLNIKTPTAKTKVQNLSGGNQQKVVFAKWILANSKLLLLDDPTQGVDVGAIEEVHKVILDFTKKQNNSVLLISSEINEIMQLSDRILIIHDGEIIDEINGATAKKEDVMEIAFGGKNI